MLPAHPGAAQSVGGQAAVTEIADAQQRTPEIPCDGDPPLVASLDAVGWVSATATIRAGRIAESFRC
jgi:hypothetical protein